METPDLKTETRTEKQMLKVKFEKQGANGVYLEFTETHYVIKKDESDTVVAEDKNVLTHKVGGTYQPHKDFVDAMKMLRKHVIAICELGNFKNFEKYRINGITLSGMDSDDEAMVVISAGKELESGKVFNFVTPATPLADNASYGDSKQLDEFCANITKEAWEYINGKHAENPQLSLQFEGGENVNMAVQEE